MAFERIGRGSPPMTPREFQINILLDEWSKLELDIERYTQKAKWWPQPDRGFWLDAVAILYAEQQAVRAEIKRVDGMTDEDFEKEQL